LTKNPLSHILASMKLHNPLPIVAGVLIVALVIIAIWQQTQNTGHHAVFLETGNIYFGELVTFPKYGLRNVYYLQVLPESQGGQLSLQKFTELFWQPQDFIQIDKDKVIWTAKLDPEGDLATLIRENPSLTAPNRTQPPPPEPEAGVIEPGDKETTEDL
jgi:hypothetical protein